MALTPPPWQNITGISRAVMKDNAQETLTNYNGSARPGEIVADLTTDPPALYVGNNAGALTAISSGSGGNISGSGSVITAPVPLANLTAVTGARAFVSDGNLTAAGNFGAQIGSGGANTVPVWSDGANWYVG